MISAADMHDVGCPEFAAVVMRIEWMRSSRAFSASAAIFPDGGALCVVPAMFSPKWGSFIVPDAYHFL